MCINSRLGLKKLFKYIIFKNKHKMYQEMSTSYQNDSCVIAVGQLSSTNNKQLNLQNVDRLVQEAVEKYNVEMVYLPEATDYIASSQKELVSLAEPIDGPMITCIKNIARKKKVWLSLGFHEKVNTFDKINVKIFNTQIIINNTGEIIAKYRKLHLFDVIIPEENINLQESKSVSAGCSFVEPVPTPAGNVGMLICYDLRFPEISTKLRQLNATILTYPSAFTHRTGEDHWESLLRARAIENQCYVIAAAQVGVHYKDRISHGRSMIIDPWGKILAECPQYYDGYVEDGSIICATIENSLIEDIRKRMPVLNHRRSDIYKINIQSNLIDLLDCDMKFANKTIPANTIFYRTTLSFAFTNIRCVVPGHVLISSKRIVSKISDLTSDEIADLFQVVIKIQNIMEKIHNVTSSSLVVQDGKEAGQTVPHVHCHVLPRRPGDFHRNDDIYQTLAQHDAEDSDKPFRSPEEMAKEAQEIRKALIAFG